MILEILFYDRGVSVERKQVDTKKLDNYFVIYTYQNITAKKNHFDMMNFMKKKKILIIIFNLNIYQI